MLPLIALALIAHPATAAAQDWVKLPNGAPNQFWIDRDSVREADGLRYFRMRLVLANGIEGFAEVSADCATKTSDFLKLEFITDGKVARTVTFQPGERRQQLDDAPTYAIACGPLPKRQ